MNIAEHFISFFAISLINSIIQEHECLFCHMTLKLLKNRISENVKIWPSFMQCYNRRHYIS